MSHPDPAVLPVGTLHSLEWFWVSRRIFIYSHHNTFVFFSKTSVGWSILPRVCRRHGFRSITQVCVGISISKKFHKHIVCGYGQEPVDFQWCHFQNGRLGAILVFRFLESNFSLPLNIQTFTDSYWSPDFNNSSLMSIGKSLLIFSNVTFKMAAW